MANDLGKQGGSDKAYSRQPDESETPKTGFASAPDNEQHTFNKNPGGYGRNPNKAH